MIAIQITFCTFIITMMTLIFLGKFQYDYTNEEMNFLGKLENKGILSMFTTVFILYIIVLKKLISTLSKKYPKFYQQERKHIIITTSIILASILMRIIRFALFSTEFFSNDVEESFEKATLLHPMVIFVFLCTTTLMQISAVLFQLRKYILQMKKI